MVAHVTPDDITVWLTGTSAPCTSVFKPVWFDGGLPEQPRPGERFDAGTMWWSHEVLHRATLQNYPDRIAAYADHRDDLEARFLQHAATTTDRASYTQECFAMSAAAEREWLRSVRDIPAADNPRLYARAWRKWDELAGMP